MIIVLSPPVHTYGIRAPTSCYLPETRWPRHTLTCITYSNSLTSSLPEFIDKSLSFCVYFQKMIAKPREEKVCLSVLLKHTFSSLIKTNKIVNTILFKSNKNHDYYVCVVGLLTSLVFCFDRFFSYLSNC